MIDSINFKPDESAPQRQSFDEWVQVPAARAKKDDRCSSSYSFVFRKDFALCCFVLLCFVFRAVAAGSKHVLQAETPRQGARSSAESERQQGRRIEAIEF